MMATSLTNFTFDSVITDKSDKTVITSNADFLLAIFGNPGSYKEHPMIVSFKGNPQDIDNKKWFSRPWTNVSTVLSADANNYFSLSRFKANEIGKYRRKKSQFCELCVIMLDDIGSKVSTDRITLQPSWILETSPGNFQVGYILREPISENKLADQVVKAFVQAGLCDPGANGPTARLARLPVAVNGKHAQQFRCQLKLWKPENRYSFQELINYFQLELSDEKRSKSSHIQTINANDTTNANDTDNEQIWTPGPKENTVVAALTRHSLYKSPLGEGKHDITCPWVNEHTALVNSGTAYFEPDDNYPLGGFKCFHGHCSERHIRDLLGFLNVDLQSARMKPTIHVVKGEIHRIVDIAERELAATKQYYQRGGMIVSVYIDGGTNQTQIQPVSQSVLVRALASIAIWEQFDGRSKNWTRIDPPARHTSILYDSNNYRHLPLINGLARQPYLRTDGSIMLQANYDTDTGMFGIFDSRQFLIPDKPGREDAQSALELLNELLKEFDFATERDHAAALSAILTAAIRPSLINAPMIHVRAHAVGSGKSYLCSLITAFAAPQKGTPTTFPADDEECRKLLLAELLYAPAVIEFDNITSDILPHKSLCTALTSEFISGRILGVSKTAKVSTRTLFLSSGNNVTPIKDMARRCITINLNPEIEIPAAREFKRPDLISEVFEERERYVSAAITLVRAWIIAGRPKFTCKSLAGFNDWSDLCRQPLLWLGYVDPAGSIFEALKEDPDREQLGRLLMAWKNTFKNVPAMVREAVNGENEELREILHDIADERGVINRLRLGRWIKRHEGQIVDSLRFVRCSGHTSAERWRVESVSSVL
ncbi:Uncharacterised protein (plasmid) [Legionella adelaidensis]|uniref:Uncharacterized protein n=1 Tax=Legionella adelaidensis TaxID=45056 RepID=A0A0W0R0U9_9GAMM|nr:DNA-primase RepB domain-containing protein [Legionella adelaidensis]KTC64690.1 hypothetical protein Lade_1984 [Legionella adelaidensis]VEH86158.1 Uncharacterised protein [Legionella adelaidensis]